LDRDRDPDVDLDRDPLTPALSPAGGEGDGLDLVSSRDRLRWLATYLAVPALVVAFHARAAAPGQAFVGQDLRNFFFGVREAVAAHLRAGQVPGWQRGFFLGYPLLGDPQAALLDPATWLTLPWDAPRALTLGVLLHLVGAGWGMLAWLRARGLGPAEALLGAILFALGAKQTVHVQHWIFAASCAWWPWMLAGLDRFAKSGRGRHLLLTALAAALSWLGGAAQMAYFGTLVAGAYALTLAPTLGRRRPADALLALVAAPLGLLLAAPVVLPVLELAGLGPRGAGVGYAFATSWKWPDRFGLALFLVPNAFGGRWYIPDMNLWEATGYLGILPLGLAAAAPLRRRGLWLFLALGVVGVWLSFGEDAWLGLHRALYRFLPGYGAFRNPTRSLMVTSLASAVLAAEGLAALRAPDSRGRRWLGAGLVLAAVVALTPNLIRLPGFSLDPAAAREGARTTVVLALLGLAWLAAGRTLLAAHRWSGPWVGVALLLCAADLYLAFGDMNPVGPAAEERAALADLTSLVPAAPAPRRVAVIAGWGRTANAPLRNGWEGVTGYGPTVIDRVRRLLEATRHDRLAPPGPIVADTNFPRPLPTSALWPLLAAPIVVADEPLALPVLGELQPEYDRATFAYSAPALPRVFWTGAWEVAGDEALRARLREAARGDRAVLAPGPSLPLASSGAPAGPVAASDVRVVGGLLEATLTAPRDGVAVVLDPWFPGWQATLDGTAVPLARADYAFMAVAMPAGRHRLRLEYHPTQLGRGIALAAGTMVALLAALAWRRRRMNPRPTRARVAAAGDEPRPTPVCRAGACPPPPSSTDSDPACTARSARRRGTRPASS
ncbi:MAG TPA: YfhO family protein, partial [Anaeromyxobacteraceae bacterium]|nr:YfhO family protein [Anaeromyxobacteraceae bacterium]